MVHRGGFAQLIPILTSVREAIKPTTLFETAATASPIAAATHAITTCQVRSLVRSEWRDHKTIATTDTVRSQSESRAKKEAREAAVAAETAIAEAENALALRKADLQKETDKAAAEAASARPLAEAQSQQAVVAQQEITAQKRASLRAAELESEVKAVADAEAYRVKTIAQAAADSKLIEAQSARDARKAAADALEAEGLAEAKAIAARGEAEASATKAAAEAVAQQSEALLQLKVIEALPLIARELAAPMSNIDQLTVISTDGASQLAKNAASGLTEVDGVLKSTMGLSIRDLLGSFVGGAAAGQTFATNSNGGPAVPRTNHVVTVDLDPESGSETLPVS